MSVALKKYKLGDLMDVTRGASLAGEHYATEGDLVRLTLGNFDYDNCGFKENTSKDNIYYTGDVNESFILNEGDVITPLTEQTPGLLGTTARIPESGKYIQSQDIALIKCKPELLDRDYAYYLLPSKLVKEQLAARAQQTKIRHTSPDKIKDCTVFIPNLDEQKKIAAILRSIDDKIAVNTDICRKLERSAKEIYDFYFNNIQISQCDWREISLCEIIERKISGDWGTEEPCGNTTFRVSCVRGADMKDLTHLPTRYIRHKEDTLLADGDIVVEISGGSPTQSTGRSVLITEDVMARFNDRVICSNFCRGLRFKISLHGYFYFLVFKSLYDTGCFFNYEGKTSGLHNLDIDAFLENKIRIPSDDELTSISLKLKSLYSQISTLETENLNLTKERDYLHPLLISDQLSIIE